MPKPKAAKLEKATLTPERTCVGCGTKKPQCEMLRVASQSGDTPVVDKQNSAPGRGAYWCYDGACLQRAWKRRAFERALKLRDGMPREVREELEKVRRV